MDLFKDKIANSDRHLRLYFPHYTGKTNGQGTCRIVQVVITVFGSLVSFNSPELTHLTGRKLKIYVSEVKGFLSFSWLCCDK